MKEVSFASSLTRLAAADVGILRDRLDLRREGSVFLSVEGKGFRIRQSHQVETAAPSIVSADLLFASLPPSKYTDAEEIGDSFRKKSWILHVTVWFAALPLTYAY